MTKNIEIRPADSGGVVVQFCYYGRPLAQRVASELVNKLVDISHNSAARSSLFDLGIFAM